MMGEEAKELYATLDFSTSTTDSKKFDKVLQSLEDYFPPITNKITERHKFNSRMQEKYESVDLFVTAAVEQTQHCSPSIVIRMSIRFRKCGSRIPELRHKFIVVQRYKKEVNCSTHDRPILVSEVDGVTISKGCVKSLYSGE
ncbi:hypothetical protein PR048_011439 [Dryococelus australis]|uniref:Uncharacterized protein n=1 Tax=Dryococelus australis TaxID=614101 RepID=A0ABQ9HLL2_9NEOP|nr:hypothetical protein PR048_011439 [Dryococelus australis]